MRNYFNIGILAVMAAVLVCGPLLFGGVLPQYALPLYGLGALLLLWWAGKCLCVYPVALRFSVVHGLVLAFAGYAWARYFFAPVEHAARLALLQIGLAVAAYFVAAMNLRRPRDRAVVLIVLLMLAVGEAIYGLGQVATQSPFVYHLERYTGPTQQASGTFFHPNHFAGFLEIVLCLLLAYVVVHRGGWSRSQARVIRKLFEIWALGFVVAGLVMSLSRGGLLGAGVGLLAFLGLVWRSGDVPRRVIDVGLGLIVVAGIFVLVQPSWQRRLLGAIRWNPDYTWGSSPVTLRDSTLSARVPLARASWAMIRDRPWFGNGPGAWRWLHGQYRDPSIQWRPEFAHSDFLQAAAEYGVVGWGLLLAIAGFFLRHVLRLSRSPGPSEERAWAIGTGAAVVALAAHSLVDFNLQIPSNAVLLATLMGMTMALAPRDAGDRRPLPRWAVKSVGIFVLIGAVGGGWVALRTLAASRAVARGQDALQASDWEQAVMWFDRARRWDARNPDGPAGLGEVYRMRSALELEDGDEGVSRDLAGQAVIALREATRLNSYQTDAWLRLASAAELAGDTATAAAAYQQALAVDPRSGFVYLRWGTFLLRQNDIAGARAALAISAELDWTENTARSLSRILEKLEIEGVRRQSMPP